jgi:WD40 repeat protein
MTVKLPKLVAANIHEFTGRTWLLPKLLNWWDHDADRFLLLTGGPGSGKTMLLAWLAGFGPAPEDAPARAQLSRLRKAVKATHFCQAASRNITPRAFAESVANQLTHNLTGFREALTATLKDRLQITATQTIGSVVAGATVTGVSIGRIDLGGLGDELSFDQAFTLPLNKLYEDGDGEPILLLVDALDEAQAYSGITLADLLSRIADMPAPVRILASSRDEPRVLKFFRDAKSLDLVKDTELDTDDVQAYVEARLANVAALRPPDCKQFAARLARQASGVFLYAAIVLDSLLERPPSALPDPSSYPLPERLSGLYHAFLTRELGKDDHRWFDVYEPLLGLIAVSQGEGLTSTQLSEIVGRDTRAELRACKQYLSGELPRGPFRPFHRSFADFLLEEKGNADFHIDEKPMHTRIAAYFSKQCHDRQVCDEYGLLNLPFHAERAGILGQFVNDELLLVMADPEGLLRVLLSHAGELSRDIVRVYQGAIHHLPEASFAERASYLQMIARRDGLNELADRLTNLSFILPFSVLWTTWQSTTMNRVVAASVGVVGGNLNTEVVADLATYEGRIVAATGCQDGAVRVWEVATGKLVGAPLAGQAGPIAAVAIGELDHRTVIVSSNSEGGMQVWDVALTRPIAGPIRTRAYGGAPARSIAVSTLGGLPVIVSGGSHGNIEVWELATGKPVSGPMVGFGGVVHWVALSERENRAVVLALHNDRGLRIWDVVSGQTVGQTIASECYNFARVRSVALAKRNGIAVVVAGGGDGNIRAWDIATGRLAMEPLPAHSRPISALVAAELEGQPVIVTGDDEGTIRLWDLVARRLLGESIRQHDGSITFLAEVTLEGRAAIVSGGGDGVLRASELNEYSSTTYTRPSPPHADGVKSLTLSELDGRAVVVTGGFDGVLRVWDLATGRPAAEPIHAHVNAAGRVIAAGQDDSRLIVSVADDPTLDAHDWETHQRIGDRLYGFEASEVSSLAVGATFESHDGRVWTRGPGGGLYLSEAAWEPVAVAQPRPLRVGSSSGLARVVRAWNPSTGHAVGKPVCSAAMGEESAAAAVLDGRPVILTAEFGQIGVWDLVTGQPIGKPLNAEAHVNTLCAAQWNGRCVVISGDNQGTVRAFDVAAATPLSEPLRGNGGVSQLSLAIIGGRLVIGCVRGNTIDLSDLATGLPVGRSIESPHYVTSFAIGELGERLAVITSDLGHGDGMRVWDGEGNLQRDIKVDGSVFALEIAPRSQIVVGSSKGLMVLKWNPDGRRS